MSKELRDKRNELLKKSTNLRCMQFDTDYEKGKRVIEEQDKVYNHWKFYDEFIKASEKVKEKENEK